MVKIATLCGTLLLVAAQTAFAEATNPDGNWRMDNGKVTVKVTHCYGDKICASVIALAKPLRDDGSPKVDEHNPNRALRSRPIIGMQIIDGMANSGDNYWKGKIYSSDDGGIYSAYARIDGDFLHVKGCWGPFCKKLDFKRVK
jgi:uncharacterized protein (DUF2147 family)